MHQWAYLLGTVGSVTVKGKFYHQIGCRSFFSDMFLRVDQEIKNKEDRKTEVKRFCTSYDYAKELQHPIHSFQEKIGENHQKAIIQWDEVRRKLIKQCCTKGTQDTGH